MTMHLEGPWLSTTSTRKRAEKLTKARQAELVRDWNSRNKWLVNLHLPKQTFEQYLDWVYGRGEKSKTKKEMASECSSSISKIGRNEIIKSQTSENVDGNAETPTISRPSIWVTGPCTIKQTPTYTGTKILGIGTMHKSNAVPIFSSEEAEDISKMRR
jgi:hypothetical protein